MLRKNEAVWIEKNNRWQIKVQKDGERKTFYSSLAGKKGKIEAEHKADAWLENLSDVSAPRFGMAFDDYLKYRKEFVSENMYINDKSIYENWIKKELQHRRIESLTLQDMQDCIDKAFKSKGLARKSLQNIRGVFTSFYKYCYKRKYRMENPQFIEIPRSAESKGKKILQPADVKKLFLEDTYKTHNKTELCFFIYAWRFLVVTGLRRGELCGLKVSDIKDGVISVKRSINERNQLTKGKNENAIRQFILTKQAIDVLKGQKKMLFDKGITSIWLFPSETGEMLQPRHFYKLWKSYSKQHGMDCSLHELRHTFISNAKADVPVQLLKSTIGHSASMDTYGQYGHEVDNDMKRTAKILNKVIKRVLK